MTFSKDVTTDSNPRESRDGNTGRAANNCMLRSLASCGKSGDHSVTECETAEEEKTFKSAVITGIKDLEAGRELSLAQAKVRLLGRGKIGLASDQI